MGALRRGSVACPDERCADNLQQEDGLITYSIRHNWITFTGLPPVVYWKGCCSVAGHLMKVLVVY
jgi:hypothetical protein